MVDNSGRPPRLVEARSLPRSVRQPAEDGQFVYWFPGWVAKNAAALMLNTDGDVWLLWTTKFTDLQLTALGHVARLSAQRHGYAGLDFQANRGTVIEFDSQDQAVYVLAILAWAQDAAPDVLRGGTYDCLVRRCVYLGGAGLPLVVETAYDLVFRQSQIEIFSSPASWVFPCDVAVPLAEVSDLALGGPGVVTTGGGFFGGGFGVMGAAKGMLAAEVLNRLTTKRSIWSTVTLVAHNSEAFFVNTELPPNELRMSLSQVYVRLDQHTRAAQDERGHGSTGDGLADQLERLQALRDSGVLSAEEFDAAKRRLLGL